MLADCIQLVQEVWNPYGNQQIELIGGAGAMRDKNGQVIEGSLLKVDTWEFKVGFRPPIWCVVGDDYIVLSKYPASYESDEEKFSTPDKK